MTPTEGTVHTGSTEAAASVAAAAAGRMMFAFGARRPNAALAADAANRSCPIYILYYTRRVDTKDEMTCNPFVLRVVRGRHSTNSRIVCIRLPIRR